MAFCLFALAAKYHSVAAAVTLGTTTGMMHTDGLAVFLGEGLAGTAQMKWIRWIAAGLFPVGSSAGA
jgi:putative Ca2+/H+ antiporter (TMEM165/GDT1 family)